MNTEIIMPDLGAASDEAVLVTWFVREGDRVEVGQPMYEIETDKSTVTVEATDSGQMGRLLVEAGATVPLGTPIAEFQSDRDLAASADVPSEVVAAEPVHPEPQLQHPVSESDSDPGSRARVSPRARRLAASLGIDLTTLVGTGPGGLVTEDDVSAANAGRAPASDGAEARGPGREEAVVGPSALTVRGSSPNPDFDGLVGLTGSRAVIARRMTASSRETAAVTLFAEADADGLVARIASLRIQHPDLADGFTLDLLVARCVALALQEHPQLNVSLTSAGIVTHESIDIGIALDTESGLMVAVLRDTATLPLLDLARAWRPLRARVLAGSATPVDTTGGTFTITNLGHLGVILFTPIINPGEAAILGVGRIAERPAVRDRQVVAARTIPLSLTFDHRIVDGAPAARFLRRVRELIEGPASPDR